MDGQPPFSDQTLVEARAGTRQVFDLALDGELAAVAIVAAGTAHSPTEVELVVAPSARHRGLGARLLAQLLTDPRLDGTELRLGNPGSVLIWAHGDHPDARALAARFELIPQRQLFQLRLDPVRAAPVHLRPVRTHGAPAEVTAFQPGVDDAEWLALNARAFADHPEQGQLSQTDLESRLAEPWFNAADFLIARDALGVMTGFCWLKIEGEIGEFYAVAVSPAAQGSGLGRSLVNAGLARLLERQISVSSLYVEGENTAALALYRSVGFTDHTVDVQYRGIRRPVTAG
ncbi:MAG: mycothiol synthase [Microbacteriaceae bacterium]|nr:mycothiol synthase [Microbacteriaceae bacterium]